MRGVASRMHALPTLSSIPFLFSLIICLPSQHPASVSLLEDDPQVAQVHLPTALGKSDAPLGRIHPPWEQSRIGTGRYRNSFVPDEDSSKVYLIPLLLTLSGSDELAGD